MTLKLRNWAGNYEYSTVSVQHPQTVEQVQALVRQTPKLKALGTRHSFNTIADSVDQFIALDQLDSAVSIDRQRSRATIGARFNYGELAEILQREGYALHNLASLPHISVVGACATATHGSGVGNQNLSSEVAALDLVTADGELVSLSRERDGETFLGAVVGLGALGVVVSMTLDVLPTFHMRQNVFENLPINQLETHFDEIVASAYSVSLFTDWQTDRINEVWLKAKADAKADDSPYSPRTEFFGATAATKPLHPIASVPPENCTEQLGVVGSWNERLPHFRYDAMPSAGSELQSEYFVARADALAALRAIRSLAPLIAPHLLISEIRTIAADNFWMSPCRQQDSVGIHFTWKMDWPSVKSLLPQIEARLAPFDARPHWGKLFTMPPARLQALYPKLLEFRQLIQHFDPHGKFRNAFLETNLFGN